MGGGKGEKNRRQERTKGHTAGEQRFYHPQLIAGHRSIAGYRIRRPPQDKPESDLNLKEPHRKGRKDERHEPLSRAPAGPAHPAYVHTHTHAP